MLFALPVLASADGTFTVTDRTEVRVRDPDPITNAAALDLDTLLDARATVATHKTLYTLAYLPRFTLLDINGAGIQPALLNGGLASVEWHSHRTTLSLTEKASYGQLSFESLAALPAPGTPTGPTPPPGQPTPLPTVALIPPAQSVLYESSETTLASVWLLNRWTSTAKVGYQLSGGADSTAQQLLPLQHGPFAEATADYRLGPHDHVTTVGTGAESSFSIGTEDLLGEIEERWRHRWTPRTETMVSAGVAGTRTRVAFDAPYATEVDPVAEAALDQHFVWGRTHGELRIDARLAPIVNQLIGLVDERIQGTVEGIVTRRPWTLRAYVTAGESVNQGTPIASQLVAGELDASYKVSEALTFDAGARTLYQIQNSPGLPATAGGPTPIVAGTYAQSVLFVAMTVRAVKVKF